MADKETYNGSVPLPSGLKTYNERDYPLIDAHYVWVKNEKDEYGVRLDKKIEDLGMSKEVQNALNKLETTVTNLSQKVSSNTGRIEINEEDIQAIQEQLEKLNPDDLGKIYRSFYNTETYQFYFYQIPKEEENNEPSQEQVDRILEDGVYYVYQVEIKGGGGAGIDLPRIRLTKVSPKQDLIYLKKDSDLIVTFDYLSYFKTDAGEEVTSEKTTAQLIVNDEVVESKLIANGQSSFNVSNYLKVGENSIRVTASISGYETDEGKPIKIVRSINWTVNVVELVLSALSFDETALYQSPAEVGINFSVTGNIDKTLHYVIDNKPEVTKPLGTRSPARTSVDFMDSSTSHGDHSIKVWVTGEIEGDTITSNSIFFNSFYIHSNETTPIIRSNYNGDDIYQYDTKSFEFSVYNPEKESTPVEIYIDGKLQTTINAKNGESQYWSYRPMNEQPFVLTLKISNNVKKEWRIKVIPFGEDIQEVDGAMYDFNPSLINKNNSDEDRGTYAYSSKDGNIYTLKASDNFDWFNGGWKTDKNGIKYFHIMRGTSVSIDYKLFKNTASYDWSKSGKNFKIIFQTDRCRKMDSAVMSSYVSKIGEIDKEVWDDDGNISHETVEGETRIGVEINAQEAYLYGDNVSMKAQFMEDELTELEFNIQPTEDYNGFREYVIYNASDPIQGRIYLTDSHFDQGEYDKNTFSDIVIGSEDCDIKLYRFKAYNRSLSMDETYQNYVADSLNAEDRATRISRNDIYTDSSSTDYDGLSLEKIKTKFPDLRIITIECPKFTEGKKYSVTGCTVKQIMGNGAPEHNWIARNVTMKGQGTSSEFYGPSGRNLDLKFIKSDDIQDSDGNKYAFVSSIDETMRFNKYAMTDNSVPINYVNIKVNVASSENANNAVLAEDYNTYQPYIRPMRLRNPKVRDTMEFHPCVIFVRETDPTQHVEFKDENWHFYACGDFGNSKKNGEAMGMWMESEVPEKDLPPKAGLECIIEFASNNNPQQFLYDIGMSSSAGLPSITVTSDGKLTDNGTTGVKIWDGAFEFRYPDTGDYLDPKSSDFAAHKANIEEIGRRFKTMWDWVASTNTDGVSAAEKTRREKKFRDEFDRYFVSDSLIYHYLFTERHTMIDNRGKNLFIHLNVEEGDNFGKWDFVFDYDNDTAEGCDNLGNLRFPYGKEDIDRDENGAMIYNSSNSVLWRNIRNCFDDRLNSLMGNPDVAGFYSSQGVIERFDNYQWVKPERLEMLDMWRKYLRPWEEKKDDGYIWRMNGRKTYQRRQFETYQGVYIESKYKKLSTTSNIKLRSYRSDAIADAGSRVKPGPTDNSFHFIPYCDLYCGVTVDGWGTQGHVETVRSKANEVAHIPYLGNINTFHETNIQIPAGQYYNDIGDLAYLYPSSEFDLNSGSRLKKISLGYEDNEYSRTIDVTSSIISRNNTMVERMDLRRAQLVTKGLDTSATPSLLYINTKGSNVTTVAFANGGLLEEAYLNAVTGLTLRNLLKVKVFDCIYDNLESITYENCNDVINLKSILFDSPKLRNAYLYNIDLELPDTNLLNKMCDDFNNAVLTGTIRVPELRPSEKRRYKEKWGDDLEVIGTATNEYLVSYYNYDGTPLMENVPYDQNASLKSPLKEDNGPDNKDPLLSIYQIDRPQKPSTPKYTFDFKGWGTSISGNETITLSTTFVQSDMKLYAKYQEEIRYYDIYWRDANKIRINASDPVRVPYGGEAVFPDKYKIPAREPNNNNYYLFDNWDQSTGYVTEDMDVDPVFMAGTLPSVNSDTEQYTPAQLYAIVRKYRETNLNLSNYLKGDSIINLQMGYVPTFNNVDEEVFADNYVVDGNKEVKDTEIKLMQLEKDTEGNNRYKNWTMMLDITYENNNAKNIQTIAYCRKVLDLQIPYSFNGEYLTPIMTVGNMNNSDKVTISGNNEVPRTLSTITDKGHKLETKVYIRENIVLRYSYDTNLLTVYKNNKDLLKNEENDAKDIVTSNCFSINITDNSEQFGNLIFGGAENPNPGGAKYRYYGSGVINYGKIWWADLGEEECKKIASWTYNKQPMIFVGSGNYTLSDGSGAETAASFVCYNKTLNSKHRYSYTNANAGGWKYSEIRTYLNGKVLYGINPVWKQIIAEVELKSLRGGQSYQTTDFPSDKIIEIDPNDYNKASNDILISNSKLYIPAAYEVSHTLPSDYSKEVNSNQSYGCYVDQNNRLYNTILYENSTLYQPWSTRTPAISNISAQQVVQNDGSIADSIKIAASTDSYLAPLYPYIQTPWQPVTQDLFVVFGFSMR